MRKNLLVLLPSLLLSGCVVPKYNYYPETTRISEPPLNTVVTAYVGDNMLRQGQYTEHDAIYLRRDVKMGILGEVTATRGYYLKTGEDSKSEFYRPPGGPDSGQVLVHPVADPVEAIRVAKQGKKLCCVTILHAEDCTTKADYERKKYAVRSDDSFQQTLIYSGTVGDKINVGYREFSSSVARPAFNNEVEYDLSESKIIGYKGAQIEVIEATNEYIKYRVIQNFNRAQY